MPNTASAKKQIRQDQGRAARNKERRSRLRSTARTLREAVEAGDKSNLDTLLVACYRAIDKAAKHNVLHANTAANKKSNLARLVHSAS